MGAWPARAHREVACAEASDGRGGMRGRLGGRRADGAFGVRPARPYAARFRGLLSACRRQLKKGQTHPDMLGFGAGLWRARTTGRSRATHVVGAGTWLGYDMVACALGLLGCFLRRGSPTMPRTCTLRLTRERHLLLCDATVWHRGAASVSTM